MPARTMKVYKAGEYEGSDYVRVPNCLPRTCDLSGTEFKVLCFMLSHKNGFSGSVSVAAMLPHFKEGKGAINRAINQLEKLGFMDKVHAVFPGEKTARWIRFVTHDPKFLDGPVRFNDDMVYSRESGKVLRFDTYLKSASIDTDSYPKSASDSYPKSASLSYTEKAILENTSSSDKKMSPDAALVKFIKMWNLLESRGHVTGTYDVDKPTSLLLEAFDNYQRFPSLKHVREALSDLDAVYVAIEKAAFLKDSNGKPKRWFTLEALLTDKAKKPGSKYYALNLMGGRYEHGREAGTNGRSQGERGAGHGDAVRSSAARVRNRDYSGIVGEKV